MNTKSTICKNWAKSLKLYKIVQILVRFFDTSIIAEKDLEHLVSLYTRSAYHHRIRSDYHNDPTVLIYNKKTAKHQIWLMQITSTE